MTIKKIVNPTYTMSVTRAKISDSGYGNVPTYCGTKRCERGNRPHHIQNPIGNSARLEGRTGIGAAGGQIRRRVLAVKSGGKKCTITNQRVFKVGTRSTPNKKGCTSGNRDYNKLSDPRKRISRGGMQKSREEVHRSNNIANGGGINGGNGGGFRQRPNYNYKQYLQSRCKTHYQNTFNHDLIWKSTPKGRNYLASTICASDICSSPNKEIIYLNGHVNHQYGQAGAVSSGERLLRLKYDEHAKFVAKSSSANCTTPPQTNTIGSNPRKVGGCGWNYRPLVSTLLSSDTPSNYPAWMKSKKISTQKYDKNTVDPRRRIIRSGGRPTYITRDNKNQICCK